MKIFIKTLFLLVAFTTISCEKEEIVDCNGIKGGSAFIDECDECVGGSTEKEPCTPLITGTFTDPRDSYTYNTIVIGTQTWMSENLKYETTDSWCYDNDSENCDTYGRLYNWAASLTACPTGWHLPSIEEWQTLADYLGGDELAGGEMKSITGWNDPNTGATNKSGFSALPGGFRDNAGLFFLIGTHAVWWSSTEVSSGIAWYTIINNTETEYNAVSTGKLFGYTCRCIMD
jgi:uncharacterized protein (TIGR02145 family)